MGWKKSDEYRVMSGRCGKEESKPWAARKWVVLSKDCGQWEVMSEEGEPWEVGRGMEEKSEWESELGDVRD